MESQTQLRKEFDRHNNLIQFGNNKFQIFLKKIQTFSSWEAEDFEFKTWHIFLKFNEEYNKDPTTIISYKFLKQKGDFRDKKNATKQLEALYVTILNQNLISNKKDLDEETWAQYLEPILQQKHLI